MRQMNRALVGTMLEVARGRRSVAEFAALLKGRPRSEAGADAAAARAVPRRGLLRLTANRCAGGCGADWGERRRRSLRRGRAPEYPGWMLNVLLTNDDGIEADGLQAMRRALVALDGRAAGRDRARRQPLGDGALDHHAPAAVGRARCRSPTAASATRPTARPSTACGWRASAWSRASRPTSSSSGINHGANLGDDITYSGTVAAALEGVVLGLPGDRRLPAVRAPAQLDYSFDGGFGFEVAAAFVARLVGRIERVAAAAADAAQRQRPGGRPDGRRGGEPRQAHLPRRAEARARGGAPPALLDLRRRPRLPGRAGHRPRRGGRAGGSR